MGKRGGVCALRVVKDPDDDVRMCEYILVPPSRGEMPNEGTLSAGLSQATNSDRSSGFLRVFFSGHVKSGLDCCFSFHWRTPCVRHADYWVRWRPFDELVFSRQCLIFFSRRHVDPYLCRAS